jgi:hypothetical protein
VSKEEWLTAAQTYERLCADFSDRFTLEDKDPKSGPALIRRWYLRHGDGARGKDAHPCGFPEPEVIDIRRHRYPYRAVVRWLKAEKRI